MTLSSRSHIAIIGAGPAGLMAAETIAAAGRAVTVYDRMPSVGRKFLMAGRGGLNLTHSEPFENFLQRYGDRADHLRKPVEAFTPADLRAWCEALGQPTFVGSSGRVFPQAMKASPLLRNWLARMRDNGVAFALRHRWLGWSEDNLLQFETPHGRTDIASDAAVLALGGASWPKLGSSGDWVEPVRRTGVAISPLHPANCGFRVEWSDLFRNRFGGTPLKRIALSSGGAVVRGEAVITQDGIEGGAVYALSAPLRDGITSTGTTTVVIDLLPDVSHETLAGRLNVPRGKQSLSTFLRKAANLSPVAIALLHETATTPVAAMTPAALADLIKAVPLRLTGIAPIARAISTAGGVAFEELDAHFMLRKLPGVFVAGEMLDWEAPTGGYLLQASFATGVAAGQGVLAWLASRTSSEVLAPHP